jgi:hypothetical protein
VMPSRGGWAQIGPKFGALAPSMPSTVGVLAEWKPGAAGTWRCAHTLSRANRLVSSLVSSELDTV